MDHVTYVKGRGNLIIGYSSDGAKGTVGFVGSHLDVVPANPADWERNPFKLVQEVGYYVLCLSITMQLQCVGTWCTLNTSVTVIREMFVVKNGLA